MFYFIFLFALLLSQDLSASNPWAIVNGPVADVRSVSGTFASSTAYDPNQETQLLYGEVVKIVARAWHERRAADSSLDFVREPGKACRASPGGTQLLVYGGDYVVRHR